MPKILENRAGEPAQQGGATPSDPPMCPVLYVHPAKQDVDTYEQHLRSRQQPLGRPYGLMPLGVPALINELRAQGIAVRGVSYPLEKSVDPAFDLRAWLRAQRGARVVLIDLHWYEHSYGAISVARLCKDVLPEAWTVLGGLTASGFAAEILASHPAVDLVIRGDAEAPLLTLVRRLLASSARPGEPVALDDVPNLSYRADGRVVENPLAYCAASEDLDRLNYADLDFLVHHDAYYVHEYIVTDLAAAREAASAPGGTAASPYRGRWIATARGCRFECSYCGGCRSAHKRLAGREGIVPRSPQAVVAELQRLQARRVIQASLSYDIAEMGRDYWRKLFSLLRKREFKIGLYNEFFQMPPTAFIKAFARSVDMEHSCLALSPLSGSERVRRLNGKAYDNAALFNLLDYLNLYNVPIFVYFSLNLPGETDATMVETLELAQRIYDHYPASLLKILTSCHSLDPFSPMQQQPGKYGIRVSFSTFEDFYTYCRETQFVDPAARTGARRGFEPSVPSARSLALMADAWDAARRGREASWWPVPPSW